MLENWGYGAEADEVLCLLGLGNLLGAGATEAIRLGLPLVCWMAIIGPFLPSNVHLLSEEAMLCQLQSNLCGKLSIVTPAVGDKLAIFWQGLNNLFYF
jgi:hypothetical protein